MSKRINISQPAVITTHLTPLSDRFWVEASDTLEQWHYVNTNEFKPNREVTPLVLTAKVEAVDPDTGEKHIDSFSRVDWYLMGNDGNFTLVSSQSASAPYYTSGFNLVVRKNITSEGSQTIKCRATAIDPRDLSTYIIEETVLLTVNRDGRMEIPTVSLQNPSTIPFNIFKNEPMVTFKAVAAYEGKPVEGLYYEWYVEDFGNGTAKRKADAYAGYVEGQGTDTLTVDAMYSEEVRISCKLKDSAEAEAFPGESSSTIVWRTPKMDVQVYSEGGSGVNGKERILTFKPIVNLRGETLTEEQMAKHLIFNFKKRHSLSQTETSMGWGLMVQASSEELKQTKGSTLVLADVYLKGAFEDVIHNGEEITHNGEIVLTR